MVPFGLCKEKFLGFCGFEFPFSGDAQALEWVMSVVGGCVICEGVVDVTAEAPGDAIEIVKEKAREVYMRELYVQIGIMLAVMRICELCKVEVPVILGSKEFTEDDVRAIAGEEAVDRMKTADVVADAKTVFVREMELFMDEIVVRGAYDEGICGEFMGMLDSYEPDIAKLVGRMKGKTGLSTGTMSPKRARGTRRKKVVVVEKSLVPTSRGIPKGVLKRMPDMKRRGVMMNKKLKSVSEKVVGKKKVMRRAGSFLDQLLTTPVKKIRGDIFVAGTPESCRSDMEDLVMRTPDY